MLRTAKVPDASRTDDQIRRLTLINSVIGISIAGISTRVFMISVPTLAVALETDILGISWALIVYQMAGIGLGVVCGRLGDIYGHHKMYGFGMAVMALGSLLCALSQDVFQLILFRFVQGVGGAMIQSSGRTLGFKAMPVGSETDGHVAPVRFFYRSAPRRPHHRLDSLARDFLFIVCAELDWNGALHRDRTCRSGERRAATADRLSWRLAFPRADDSRHPAARSKNRRNGRPRQPSAIRPGFHGRALGIYLP